MANPVRHRRSIDLSRPDHHEWSRRRSCDVMERTPVGPRFDDILDGPVWDGSGLLFCCVRRSEVHRWDATTGDTVLFRHATVRTRGLAFAPDGRLYAAQSRARRVVWLTDDGGTYYLNATLDGQRHNDPQDLVIDGAGRIWFSDRYTDDSIPGPVGYRPLPHFSVLRLRELARPDAGGLSEWELERMTFDTTSPGGIAMSRDEQTLYVADGAGSTSDPSRLKAYLIGQSDNLGSPTVLHEFADGERAAGMCTDALGHIVVTVVAGAPDRTGSVVTFDSAGDLVESHDLPDIPTNCCFGAAELRTLFITTAGGQIYASKASVPQRPV